MNPTQRTEVRTSLIQAGFTRSGYTSDLSGVGDYVETWAHRDGDVVTIQWSQRPASLTTTSPEPLNSDDENLTDHIARITSRDPEALIQAAIEADSDEVAEVLLLAAAEANDAPGMYDEPDEGLTFPLPVSHEEDRIR